MNLFDSKPVISVERDLIEKKIKELKDAVTALEKELDRRDPNDNWKWGFLGIIERGKGYIETGYKYYSNQEEAVDAYVEETKEDRYTAYYRVHKVYLDKNK